MNKELDFIISLYSRITRFPKQYNEILKIDKPMRWILADDKDQYVSIHKKTKEDRILSIDITSCFPSICRYLFKNSNPEFVKAIYDLTDKRERNILISNTLKTSGYLKILNIISKMLIFGFTLDRQDSDNVLLLEFEKDGILLACDNLYQQQIENNIDSPFLEFISKNEFMFHIDEYEYYIRCNRTSFFWNEDNKLRLKGIYKHAPEEIIDTITNILKGDSVDLARIKKIYSNKYFHIIKRNNLNELLKKYYFVDENNRILNADQRYEQYNYFKSNINPALYLKTWIYPILLFQKQAIGGII